MQVQLTTKSYTQGGGCSTDLGYYFRNKNTQQAYDFCRINIPEHQKYILQLQNIIG